LANVEVNDGRRRTGASGSKSLPESIDRPSRKKVAVAAALQVAIDCEGSFKQQISKLVT
jgi:hypothetical protein